jgi:hypothetical protein
MRAEYTAFLERLAGISGTPGGDMHVPVGAAPLSFAIAAKLATNVQFPVDLRQQWLECECVYERLRVLGTILEDINKALIEEIVKRRPEDLLLN